MYVIIILMTNSNNNTYDFKEYLDVVAWGPTRSCQHLHTDAASNCHMTCQELEARTHDSNEWRRHRIVILECHLHRHGRLYIHRQYKQNTHEVCGTLQEGSLKGTALS